VGAIAAFVLNRLSARWDREHLRRGEVLRPLADLLARQRDLAELTHLAVSVDTLDQRAAAMLQRISATDPTVSPHLTRRLRKSLAQCQELYQDYLGAVWQLQDERVRGNPDPALRQHLAAENAAWSRYSPAASRLLTDLERRLSR
jgi:hypothetical protein